MRSINLIIIILSIITNVLFGYDFSVYEKENIKYFYLPQDSSFVQSISLKIQPEIENYENIFNHRMKNKIKVFFPGTVDDYEQLTNGRLPEWSGAVAFTKDRIIIIKPQTFIDDTKMLITLKHEIIHIVLSDKLRNNQLPLWLNEGLATYFSNTHTDVNEALVIANALSTNNILELREINQLMRFNTASANLAYLEAKIAIEFLMNQIGYKNLPDFLKDLNGSADKNLVFKKYLGYDLIDFEFYWYNHQKEKYEWLVVLNFENLFWILLIVLAVIAFIIVKIRNYMKVKRWQEEELLNFEEE